MSKSSDFVAKPWVHHLVYFVVTVALFWGFLSDSSMILFSTDQFASLGARLYYKTALLIHQQFPTWNSAILSGMPTVEALYGDVLYFPMTIITAIFPIHRAFAIKMIIHVFLAGLFFNLMMRKAFRAPAFVAFVGGLFYMLNPQFFSHVYPGHDAKMYVITLLPLMIWRMKALMDTPSLLNTSILASLVGLTILTGHVQLAYFVMWGVFFYWVMHHVLKISSEKTLKTSLSSITLFWIACFVGVGIAAVQLLPPMGFVSNHFSERGVGKGFEYAASWSLHWSEFFSLWVPEFGNTLDNYWGDNPFKLNSEYTGLVPVLLATISLVFSPKPWRIFWAGIASLAVLFSLGAHTPIFTVAYHLIPGVSKFRACSMIMMWFSFGTILLSSLFLFDLSRRKFELWSDKKSKGITIFLWVAVGIVAAITVLFSSETTVLSLMEPLTKSLSNPEKYKIFTQNFSSNFVPALWIWGVCSVSILSLLVFVLKGKVTPTIFIALVAIIGAFDTIRIDRIFVKPVPSAQYVRTDWALKPLQTEMKTSPFRIFVLPGTYNQENAAGLFGLEEITGFHDNELKWYKEFSAGGNNFFAGYVQDGQLLPERMAYGNNFLALANMKYFIGRTNDGLAVLENKNTLERMSLVPNYTVMKETDIIPALMANAYDIRKTVALLEEPKEKPVSNGNTTLQIHWNKYTPNYRKAKIQCGGAGFLRLSEVYYPGWEIKIDGKKTPIYRADGSWMAIAISEGSHTIEMYPKSLFLMQSAIVSITLAILLILYWSIYAIRNKRAKKESI